MKRAYLVLGPESTGTRYLTGLLIRAGCAGDDGHVQRWDVALPTVEPLIVWRRSYPHGSEWPNTTQMVTFLRAQDYDVRALITVRDWFATEQSQLKFQPTLDIVRANMQTAYSLIFAVVGILRLPHIVVSYEALAARPQAFADKLLSALDLPTTEAAFVDGNAKWYAQEAALATA